MGAAVRERRQWQWFVMCQPEPAASDPGKALSANHPAGRELGMASGHDDVEFSLRKALKQAKAVVTEDTR